MRCVDETPVAKDAEDRRSKSRAFSPGGEEGPHQQTRASAGKRDTRGRRARTPCRGQVTTRVDEAQGVALHRVNKILDYKDAKDRRSKGGTFSTRGEEGPHQ